MPLSELSNFPGLAGNVFVPLIFRLLDTDQDGCLTLEEFTGAIEQLGQLHSGENRAECEDPRRSPVPDSTIRLHGTGPDCNCSAQLLFVNYRRCTKVLDGGLHSCFQAV